MLPLITLAAAAAVLNPDNAITVTQIGSTGSPKLQCVLRGLTWNLQGLKNARDERIGKAKPSIQTEVSSSADDKAGCNRE